VALTPFEGLKPPCPLGLRPYCVSAPPVTGDNARDAMRLCMMPQFAPGHSKRLLAWYVEGVGQLITLCPLSSSPLLHLILRVTSQSCFVNTHNSYCTFYMTDDMAVAGDELVSITTVRDLELISEFCLHMSYYNSV
jgi:hypothetical protein